MPSPFALDQYSVVLGFIYDYTQDPILSGLHAESPFSLRLFLPWNSDEIRKWGRKREYLLDFLPWGKCHMQQSQYQFVLVRA